MDDNAQSSQDQWKNSTNKNERKEVSRKFHELASTLKKNLTWNKNCEDSDKKEGDLLKLAELAAKDEKHEDEERHNINKLFRQLREERKEEDEARALLEEMQKNLEEVRRVHADVDRGPWAITLHHGQKMADVAEQRHKDPQFDEISNNFWTRCNRQGWCRQSPRNTGPKERMTNETSHSCLVCVQSTKMKGVMTFAAEWCTTGEAVTFRCVSASLFVVVNEWQYKDILDDKDKLTRDAHLSERSTCPAV